MKALSKCVGGLALFVAGCVSVSAERSGRDELVVASAGMTSAVVVVSPDAGSYEKQAADELARCIGLMCGATPGIANTVETIAVALAGEAPVLVIGQEALKAQPNLDEALRRVLKKKPQLRNDGIVLRREGNRVYLVGNNDMSHYFAAVELLRIWGCRWYIPTELGECIPEAKALKVGNLDYAFSSPFEIRSYWISWVGDTTGAADFQRRNMMTGRVAMPPTGHALGQYTKGLGTGTFNFPITDPKTAEQVASKVEKMYAEGKSFSVGMEDGSYDSDYPPDQKLMKLQWDKYFMRWSVTDPMLELYNNVAKILQEKHPNSGGKMGFLVYANMTIPPVREMKAERSLFGELAPIDIDPIHGMDDPQSPPRQEYRDMLHAWAKIMGGRLAIYDYDQGMLVWRDLPNPSHMSFRQDVKHYRDTGILGVNTESRNAIATTFLNLHIRGRLMWNPDEDVDALLAEFYPKFYGPAAEPMRTYWTAIYDAWENTICTEHEYFVAPAIYTPEVMSILKTSIEKAEKVMEGIKTKGDKMSRNEQLYVKRMTFTRYSYDVTAGYMSMVSAAATDCDYARAVPFGEKAIAVRENLTDMSGTFTTYRNYKVEHNGYAWFPGEIRQYRELIPFVDGTKGKLITKLPLEWAFRRDKDNKGVERNYAAAAIDLTYWNANKATLTLDSLKDYPDQWETLRTDIYAQALGIRHPDRQSFIGHMWYRTDVELTADQVKGATHLRFPGLFNECWLYIDGKEVAYRKQGKLWWLNDYRFEWDVDLTGKLKAGKNTIALRCNCEHHLGGMFRRPFLYEAK
ncbi:MAG: DUF4838 domain-containing protein [Planctomycetota bacterium]|nr:DUF4838 domain-containing protein [Planctomycetota bacterium]